MRYCIKGNEWSGWDVPDYGDGTVIGHNEGTAALAGEDYYGGGDWLDAFPLTIVLVDDTGECSEWEVEAHTLARFHATKKG